MAVQESITCQELIPQVGKWSYKFQTQIFAQLIVKVGKYIIKIYFDKVLVDKFWQIITFDKKKTLKLYYFIFATFKKKNKKLL